MICQRDAGAAGTGYRVLGARLALALTAVLFVTLPFVHSTAEAGDIPSHLEQKIKATFIYTLAKFVEWPTNAFPAADDPITIGVFGKDPISSVLSDVVSGKTVQERSLEVKRLKEGEALTGCHVIYIGASELPRARELLQSLSGSSVLTIAESDEFADAGGILGIRLQDSMVQFEVNVGAAKRAGLSISSKILRLGTIVDGPAGVEGS